MTQSWKYLVAVALTATTLMSASIGEAAEAQQPPRIQTPVMEGACSVVILDAAQWGGRVELNDREVQGQTMGLLNDMIAVRFSEPLESDDRLRVSLKSGGWTTEIPVMTGPGAPASSRECGATETAHDDLRDTRKASSFQWGVGWLAETFAPEKGDFRRTLQASAAASGGSQGDGSSTSATGSAATMIEFNFRPLRLPRHQQLWVAVRGTYGSRQSAVCGSGPTGSGTDGQPQCSDTGLTDPSRTLVIVKKADSAELYAGLRYEFLPLSREPAFPSVLYAICTFGAVFVEGYDAALSDHGCGAGATFTGGRLQGSYIEFTTGKTEIFSPGAGNWDRWKLDFMFVTSLVDPGSLEGVWNRVRGTLSPFIRVDLDRGKGSDSFRTLFGFQFAFARAFAAP